MGIDRKRTAEKAEAARAAKAEKLKADEPPGPEDVSSLVKHLRQVRNLIRRIREGEDAEEAWRKLNRNLRYINRAKQMALKEHGLHHWTSKNPEAAKIAGDLVTELEEDRTTATILGHPPDAVLYAESWGPNIVERDGRFWAYLGTDLAGSYETWDGANAALDAQWNSLIELVDESICIDTTGSRHRLTKPLGPRVLRRRNYLTRWSKLRSTLMNWD